MPKSNPASLKEQKLAQKLRENLRRRKAQASLRKKDTDDRAGLQKGQGPDGTRKN